MLDVRRSQGWCVTGADHGELCIQNDSVYGAAVVTWQMYNDLRMTINTPVVLQKSGMSEEFLVVGQVLPQVARSCEWPGTLIAAA